jgi:hypothetical protein
MKIVFQPRLKERGQAMSEIEDQPQSGNKLQRLQRLHALPLDQASNELTMFDSYSRTEAMVHVMLSARREAADQIKVFLEWGNMCDAPWPCRSMIADILRRACSKISLAEVLSPEERGFFDPLPDLVSVFRGCEQGRERGLHWTTSRAIAEKFARGQRCINPRPTLVTAQIPKRHILAVFANRNEAEIVLDPRRLRRLSASPHQRPSW